MLVVLQSKQLLWVGEGRKGDPNRHSSSMISSYNCTFFHLAPAFSKPHRSHAGKTLRKSIWNYLSRVNENWLFQCACRCWPLSLFDILHYTGFVCTNEWSCSLVTDLKRLITTDSCRNSLFAQEIKMCVLEPKNQRVRIKCTEADDKTPTSFSGTEFTPSRGSWWICAVVPRRVVSSLSRGSARPRASTAMSGVMLELKVLSYLHQPYHFLLEQKYMGQRHLMNENKIWSHNPFRGIHHTQLTLHSWGLNAHFSSHYCLSFLSASQNV